MNRVSNCMKMSLKEMQSLMHIVKLRFEVGLKIPNFFSKQASL